jgi:hypothetical protein
VVDQANDVVLDALELPIGTPNCTRSWLCATDISNTAWQPPTMYEHSTGSAFWSARSSAAQP